MSTAALNEVNDDTRSPRTSSTELTLASASSGNAKAWNIGLILGCVSEISRTIRFDSYCESLHAFRFYSSLLRSHTCSLVTSLHERELLSHDIETVIRRIEDLYSSESHAELMVCWREGELDASDLTFLTAEPPSIRRSLSQIEAAIPIAADDAFLAGFCFGEAFASAHYRTRAGLAHLIRREAFIQLRNRMEGSLTGVTQVRLTAELETRVDTLCMALGWSFDNCCEAMLEGGCCQNEWIEFEAIGAGIAWISRHLEVAMELTEPMANSLEFQSAEYLEISYCVRTRVAYRAGYPEI